MILRPAKEHCRRHRLAPGLILALVLAAQASAAAGSPRQAQTGRTAIDPVCGMSVDVDHAKFTSSYGGKTFYFCSESCKQAFEREPAKYASSGSEEPIEALKAKYDAAPNDVKLALRYGERLVKSNLIPEARAVFERLDKVVTARPDKADVIFQLGYVAMKERKYDEALAAWKTILNDYADTERISSAAVNTAAIRYQIKDELEPAYALLSEALAGGKILEKHLPTAYKLMLMMTYDKRDYAEAKTYLEKMPEDARQDEHIADSIWVIYLKSGEPAKGEAMLAELLARIKDDYFALYRLASIAVDAQVKIPEALGWIERSNELSKGDKFYVLDTYSQLLQASGREKQAIETLEKAISVCKNEVALKELKERLAAELAGPAVGPSAAGTRYLDRVFARVSVTRDLVYGRSALPGQEPRDLLLDLYEPEGDKEAKRGAIVWIHGGGFFQGSKSDKPMAALAKDFALRGYVTVSIDYRLERSGMADPNLRRPMLEAMEDARAAVRWVRARADAYRVDPGRIAIGGGSAGAFASLMVAYHLGGGEGASGNPGYSSAVSAVVDFWGGLPEEAAGLTAEAAPLLVIHGTADAVVPFRLAESLVRRAKAAGLVYEFHPLEGKGHAAWEQLDDYIAWIAPFLYKHVIRAPRQAPR